MHEYSGACVCFQCHDKRRSHEVTALQARVKELEAEVSELKDPMWKVPCNGDGEPCPPAILKEREELHVRVEALIEIQRAYQESFERIKTENARLVATLENSQRHYEYEMAQLRKVVDAARKVVGLVSADNCVALAKALRELDGEKKCGLCTDIKPCNFEACPDDQ